MGEKIKRKYNQSISNFVQLSIYLKVLTDKHIATNLVKWSIKKKPTYLPVAAIYTRKISVSWAKLRFKAPDFRP